MIFVKADSGLFFRMGSSGRADVSVLSVSQTSSPRGLKELIEILREEIELTHAVSVLNQTQGFANHLSSGDHNLLGMFLKHFLKVMT